MSMIRVLYKSLLRAARGYDKHPWNKAHLCAEPAIRRHQPDLVWYLGTDFCEQRVKAEFRRQTALGSETGKERIKEAFAVLQALRHHSFALHHSAAASRSSSSLSSAQFSQVFGCTAVSPFHSRAGRVRMDDDDEDEDEEEEEDDEDEDEEAEEDEEDEDADDAERMEEEAAALLESGELSDHPEASSLIRSALSALGQVQLMSAGATPLLRLTLKNREGEQEQEHTTPAGSGRTLQDEMEAARARLKQRRQQQQQQQREGEAAAAVEELNDEEEDDAVTREDIAEREDDMAQLQLAALTEGKQRDATLLSLHPFTAEELQAMHRHHAALTRALSRKQVKDEEVNNALHFFLSPPPSSASAAPLWLRLTAEDYHRLFHYWLGWEDKQEMDDGDEAAAETEEQGEQQQQQEDDGVAWSLRHRHTLFSRMKEGGYSLKRSLVRRAMRTAKSRGGVVEAMVMLRETSVGRLLPRPGDIAVQLSPTQQRRMAAFASAMRGVYDLDADMLAVKTPPKRASSKRWAACHSALLKADAPLLELAIETAASEEHTEAVRQSYPTRLCNTHLPQPPTALSACSSPLTPASNPSSQPHPSLELFALMLQHELPLSRVSTINWLLYVCDTLQLPDVAATVVLKAARDSPQLVTADLLDVLVTIACNASHLHLALRALSLYSRLGLQPPVSSYANIVNYALWGPQQTVQEAVVDGWLLEQKLRLSGWPDVRQRLLFALLEDADAKGLRGEQVVREAQRIIGRELARSMKDGLREVERWIRMKESEHWQERIMQQQETQQQLQQDEDDDDDDDDDGH